MATAQLPADDMRILQVPGVITYGAPCALIEYFNTPGTAALPRCQPYVQAPCGGTQSEHTGLHEQGRGGSKWTPHTHPNRPHLHPAMSLREPAENQTCCTGSGESQSPSIAPGSAPRELSYGPVLEHHRLAVPLRIRAACTPQQHHAGPRHCPAHASTCHSRRPPLGHHSGSVHPSAAEHPGDLTERNSGGQSFTEHPHLPSPSRISHTSGHQSCLPSPSQSQGCLHSPEQRTEAEFPRVHSWAPKVLVGQLSKWGSVPTQ